MKAKRLLAVCLAGTMCLASCKSAEPDTLYERMVLRTMQDELDLSSERIPGMSSEFCEVPSDEGYDPEYVTAEKAIFVNDSEGKLLYSKASTEKCYPASLTKCMTLYMVLQTCQDRNDTFTIPYEAVTEFEGVSASLAGLQAGETYSIDALLYGLMIPSGNDAANALAIYTSGSVEAFVNDMNETAQKLGMLNTHFANPHGLHDKNHYTTLYDLYILLHALIQCHDFSTYAGTTERTVTYTASDGETLERTYTSGNSFLKGYTVPEQSFLLLGTKTGYTIPAGRCLLCVFQKGGNYYITGVARCSTYDEMYTETNKLLLLPEEDE